MHLWKYALAVFVCLQPVSLAAQDVSVEIDAAEAVVKAVLNPDLTMDEALQVARLPGNQGLIRKAISYDRPANDDLFAKALIAAATGDDSYDDPSVLNFPGVRDNADAILATIEQLTDPTANRLEAVQARLAAFTPAGLEGEIRGYLIAGGTSGGFAFGEPEFFLNLDRFPSATFASTIMQHEMYHAIQPLARAENPGYEAAEACAAELPHGKVISDLFRALRDEGTASYVGNILDLPASGTDETTTRERERFRQNVARVGRSVTQLELSVHGLTTGADVTPQKVYELGFYGDEVLYALGYVMTRAIAEEHSPAAIAELIDRPGAALVVQYTQLEGYGESERIPALNKASVEWAERLNACREG